MFSSAYLITFTVSSSISWLQLSSHSSCSFGLYRSLRLRIRMVNCLVYTFMTFFCLFFLGSRTFWSVLSVLQSAVFNSNWVAQLTVLFSSSLLTGKVLADFDFWTFFFGWLFFDCLGQIRFHQVSFLLTFRSCNCPHSASLTGVRVYCWRSFPTTSNSHSNSES